MQNTVTVCPRCGGHDITMENTLLGAIGASHSRRCRACGYTGIFPEIDEADLEDYKADAVEHPRDPVETAPHQAQSRRRFAIGIVMLIIAPGAVFAGTLTGQITGILSFIIGGAILVEQIKTRSER